MTDEQQVRTRRRCCLYRHYDADGVLLYVGISIDPGYRTHEHAAESQRWVRFALRMEGVWYASTDAARAAELIAIRDEAPVFNSANRSSHAESEARKQAYERSHASLAVPGEHVRPRRTLAEAVEAVRQRIKAGELSLGERIESIAALAEDLNVGQDRARRAMEALVGEGWLEKPRFRGPWFVTRVLPPVPLDSERVSALHYGKGYKPAYEVLAGQLRARIEAGDLAAGDQFPTLTQIAEAEGFSVPAAQRAVEQLKAEGLVTTGRGRRGRVVRPQSSELEAS